jgi:serine/threonine protein kinase/Flp pilus assembly protein TadD
MTAPPGISSPQSKTECVLAELVEELARKLQDSETVDIEAYLDAHAPYAEALRSLLPTVHLLADLGRSAATDNARGQASAVSEGGTLGDFRIIRQIGRGGMGIVYEAEQRSLGRRVALKVLPFVGSLDEKQLQRFKNEAQAAAHLHHANIVPVFSVGCDRSVHYYAMQLIEGYTLASLIGQLRRGSGTGPAVIDGIGLFPEPLAFSSAKSHAQPRPAELPPTQVVTAGSTARDAAAPPPREVMASHDPAFFRMVATFGIQAADALEHAHQIGVIHRDIKPGNLLLDAAWKLWVTDFGLAQIQNNAELTMTGDLIGTLRYMSPEQALGNRVGLDHRTDVYSLGATLYELLTLAPSFTGKDRQELLRQIAHEDPRSPRKLNKSIPSELETIVLKAMEKSAADRYSTAQDMADDLRRFLEDKPIRARPPTIAQRAARWARRHKTVVRAAVVLLAVTAGVTTTAAVWIAHERDIARQHADQASLERDRANREAAVAQAVNDFLNDVLTQVDPKNTPDPDLKLRAVVDQAAKRIAGRFADQPLVEARLRRTLANVYLSLGIYGEAERHAIRADEITARSLDPDDPDALESSNILATVFRNEGRLDESRRLQERTLALRRRALGPEHPDTRKSMDNFALVLQNQGRLTEARKLYEQVLTVRRQTLGTDHPDTLRAMGNLGLVLDDLWELDEARQLDEEVLSVRRRILGPEHPHTLVAADNLGAVLAHQGKLDDARNLHEESLATQKRVLGPRHPQTLHTMNNLAWDLCLPALAEPEHRIRALRLANEVVSHAPGDGSAWNTLGVAHYRSGDWPSAMAALGRSKDLEPAKGVAHNGLFLAMTHWKLGEKQQAQTCYDEAVAWMQKNAPKNEELKRFRAEAEELIGIRKSSQ